MATEDSPSPHIPYPQWQNEYQPPSSSLTARSSRSGLQPQKPQSTNGFSKFRKALTIKPRGKRSKTRWQVFAFSRGTVWVSDWEKT